MCQVSLETAQAQDPQDEESQPVEDADEDESAGDESEPAREDPDESEPAREDPDESEPAREDPDESGPIEEKDADHDAESPESEGESGQDVSDTAEGDTGSSVSAETGAESQAETTPSENLEKVPDSTDEASQKQTEMDSESSEQSASNLSEEDSIGFGVEAEDAIGFGGEEDSVGFGESPMAATAPLSDSDSASKGKLTLDSYIRSQAAFWTERFNDNPLAKLRQNFDTDLRYKRPFEIDNERIDLSLAAGLHVEYDFAYLNERDSYDDPTLDTYEFQFIGRETYASLSHDVIELTFGRQIVAWGEGIVLSPVDVINPQDFREVFLVDLDDRRIAVLASKLGLYFGDHRLESIVVHESYFGLNPQPLSPFSPIRQLLVDDPRLEPILDSRTLRYKHVPGRWVQQASQFYQRWSYAGHGFDLSFYGASVLEKRGVNPETPESAFLTDEVNIEMWHPRYTMLAHSGSVPVDSMVFKWELAVDLRRPMNTTNKSLEGFNVDIEKIDQLVSMVGLQYQSIVEDANLHIEYEQHYVLDNPKRREGGNSSIIFLYPVEQPQIAVIWEHTFLNERLDLDIMAIVFGIWDYTGWLARFDVTYEIDDGLKAGIGYATFQPNDKVSLIYGLDSHDRFSANLRWDFLLD